LVHHVCFHRGLFNEFSKQNFLKNKNKKRSKYVRTDGRTDERTQRGVAKLASQITGAESRFSNPRIKTRNCCVGQMHALSESYILYINSLSACVCAWRDDFTF
jgi:hypothetical protein